MLAEDPEPPSSAAKLAGHSSGLGSLSRSACDLNILCLTAIHKDTHRRYRSAEALIRDIDHFLKGEPLEARPDNLRYKLGKYVKRNVHVLSAGALMLVTVIALVTFFTFRLARARNSAETALAGSQRVQQFILSLFEGSEKESAPSEGLRVSVLIDRGAKEAQALKSDPEVQADLFETLGGLYQKLGNLDQAVGANGQNACFRYNEDTPAKSKIFLMPQAKEPALGINSWLEDELFHQYQFDRKSVDEGWTELFEEFGQNGSVVSPNGGASTPESPRSSAGPQPPEPAREEPATQEPPREEPPQPAPAPQESREVARTSAAPDGRTTELAKQEMKAVGASDQLIPLRGAAARIVENMTASLAIPTATSQRQIPVRVIEENRNIINRYRAQQGRGKLSFTHLIAWAIVKAIKTNPSLNHAFAENGGEPFRIVRSHVNIGLAVDVAGKDGARSLKVPNIKNADGMNFAQFAAAYDDIVARARTNKLQVGDFEGTTISLTNPGTVGTLGSVPRLMPGQGAIVATGVIDYPAEFAAASEQARAVMGLSKVLMLTCTYDHRIIQGAESGAFLAKVQALLQGQDGFYETIFRELKIPQMPLRWQTDEQISPVRYASVNADVAKEAAVIQLINAYRVRGHLLGNTNPLGSEPAYHPELDPASYGLSMWDLDRPFLAGLVKAPSGAIASYVQPYETLREILDRLRFTYCGSVGVEYMHIQDPAQKKWLQDRMEGTLNMWTLEEPVRRRILNRLIQAEEFEHFLQSRFVGQKRYGLEGLESTIAVLDEVLDRGANENVHEVVIGMAHRGRLNVLANVVGKSMAQVFSEFEGEPDPESVQGSGDVKYHLGASGIHVSTQGKEILVSVAFNPSHLEAVDPVVEGLVRPKQDRLGDTNRERVIPILMHGDAALIGQGIVAEVLQLSQLEGYTNGGTIHVVTNNQIGFTTNPLEGRTSVYCTGVALSVQAPIFHVNADDPEACIRVAQLAYDYRQRFKRDVVVDIIGYRRQGHNEADDPSYTQPVMYRKIKANSHGRDAVR